ncbi:S-adenosyl-L-methionine-dependent methyltransferase [Suillus plorans]|uniref:S-adenosyl-L-methionine-dependent methyltransferase n=1 Tax=Suillus plorans TaxID=116603 RepID=A0A9P7DM15_9AGAM|nr:S-adenosyl-L-methionine-dependent methyltransferase [Suillus plorans]KAG1798189.1 S-adenosyl-L-methionine-dependent methyltransferase [Suillus plorans]
MATFAKSSFDSTIMIYATFRPTYPTSLFNFIFRWDRAVDLGCGTGYASLAVDPSYKMIEVAQGTLQKTPECTGQYEYIQASAESLTFLEDSSVDLVISAEACHWFDWNKIWPELARVLRKNGSQPGRLILDNHLIEVPDGNEVVPGAFSDSERVFFTGDYYPSLPCPRSVIIRKKMTWDDLLSYLNTWSSLHTFRQRNPTDGENLREDVAMRFWKDLKKGAEREDGRPVEGHDEVDIEWPLAMIMVKRL